MTIHNIFFDYQFAALTEKMQGEPLLTIFRSIDRVIGRLVIPITTAG